MSFLETIKKNREFFLRFNQAKFKRFQHLIISTAANANVQKVINLIPLLLSINDKKIPGYIEGVVPFGIINYTPGDEVRKYAQIRFNVNEIEKPDKPFIEMLAVMGSIGTIAYTKKSDFDYWVCIDRRGIPLVQLENFQKKIDSIQNWVMNEINIETHLFINDINNIKNNIFAEDEDEAFGSTTGAVLKDEFFRSSIIIAGKIPFWWVVPKFIRDSEYEKLFNQLPEENKSLEFVDLGNLYEISKEDFMGAALFQLIKSLGNPFKSIIKIGVLEKYLFGPQDTPLLSQKVKSKILRNDITNNIIDSYVLMFEEVYNYYNSSVPDKGLLKILRQNLYLKIDSQLSKYTGIKDSKKLPYKVQVMFRYAKEWGWTLNEIQDLDNFDNWDYNKIMNFWNSVKRFMLLSYQKISGELPSLNLKDKISETDFKLLSRKIKSHFSSGGNKIDNYVTFKDTPYESLLYIEPINKGVDEHEWNLYKRDTRSKDKFESTILKTEPCLVKLLGWVSINNIFNPKFSRIKIKSGYVHINQNVVIDLLNMISDQFSGNVHIKNEYFLNPVFNLSNMVIINFNIEKTDIIQTIHHIYQTSWGESFIDKYESEKDLINILTRILNDGIRAKKDFKDYCVIISPEPFKKHYKDIESLFKIAYDFIVDADSELSLRMLTRIGGSLTAINRIGMEVSIKAESNLLKTLATFTLTPVKNVRYNFFGDDSRLSVLNDVYISGKDDSISFVYEEKGDYIFIYIKNEQGNLFTFLKLMSKREEALTNMFVFCKNVINNISKNDNTPDITDSVLIKKLNIDRFGKHSFEDESRIIEEIYLTKYKTKGSISVSVSGYGKDDTGYSLRFPDNSITDFMSLSQVAEKVRLLKNSGMILNNFISHIAFLNIDESALNAGSTLYFHEKYRLELIMDKALK